MQPVFLLIGSPGSGKSWVTKQLKNKFKVIEHDDFKILAHYVTILKQAIRSSDKPIIANTPFGITEIMEQLGPACIPVFIIEYENTLRQRYFARDNKEIPQGHLTRQKTYLKRAIELKAFRGTSAEVLKYLIEQ